MVEVPSPGWRAVATDSSGGSGVNCSVPDGTLEVVKVGENGKCGGDTVAVPPGS